MINQDLLNYVSGEISKGTPRNIIQTNLLANGWDTTDINEAFSTLIPHTTPPVQTMPQVNINPNPGIKIMPQINGDNSSQTMVQPKVFAQPWPTYKPKSKLPILTTIMIFILLALGAVGFVFYMKSNLSTVATKNHFEPAVNKTNTNLALATSTIENIIPTSTTSHINNIVDCGTSTDTQDLPEIIQKRSDGVTITTKDYEKDKALVCFGNNLLSCNKAKIAFVTSKPDINQGVPSGTEIKNNDGQNCTVRLNIKEIMINGKDIKNKYLECPFPIKDIPDIACFMGMCLKKGAPGSTGVGIAIPLFFQMMAGRDAMISSGCTTDF